MQAILRRVLQLGLVFTTRPAEFVDRVAGLIDRLTDRAERPITAPLAPDAIWQFMSSSLGTDVTTALNEPALAETDILLAEQKRTIPLAGPFGIRNSAEELLGHVAYVLCRVLRPETVVETGVAYGSLTTYILTALEANKRGVLHSIDLPSIMDRNAHAVGRFVPVGMRARWLLHLGASRRVLPTLLKDIGPVGLFVHDSLHTKRNMAWEFSTATQHLSPRAAVLSDDVECNRAFEDWARKTAAQWALIKQVEREAWFGVALFSESNEPA